MFKSKFANDSSKSPGLLFIKVYNNWHCKIKEVLKSVGLTHPQFVVLTVTAYLHQHVENVTQKMISSHSEIDTMTTSQILKLLEKKNLIQRKPHPTDTRANIIELLPEGEVKVSQAVPLVERVDEDFFGILKDDESSFIRLLQKLT